MASLLQVSLGFPRNVVQEEILDKRAQETYTKSVSVESKLKRLLDHRRRLFDVLKASHVGWASKATCSARAAKFQISLLTGSPFFVRNPSPIASSLQ